MTELEGIKFGAGLMKDLWKELFTQTYRFGKREWPKLLLDLDLERFFRKYLERNYRKYAYVRTLLHKSHSVHLKEIYTPVSLISAQRERISEEEFTSNLETGGFKVVTGIAGSGKSIFMRKLFLNFFEKRSRRIPIVIELRDTEPGLDQIIKYILEQFKPHIHLAEEGLLYGLEKGKFCLLLDGLDEVPVEARDATSKGILLLAFRYPATTILVSSRPDLRFYSWNEFEIYELAPFSKERTLALIGKLQYDAQIKKQFLQQVETALFDTHREFLSNPLLCTMMLLTYDEFAEIPAKMHFFYAQAYDVLFTKHDIMKPFFKRKHLTALAYDDFRRAFSSFCLHSYIHGSLAMNRSEASDYASRALKEDDLEFVKVDDFLGDLTDNVCLLLRDGDRLTFLHRSFQEYFVAVFLCERQLEEIPQLIELAIWRVQDATITMMAEMNREVLESKYVLPKLKELRRFTASRSLGPAALFKLFFLGLTIQDGWKEVLSGMRQLEGGGIEGARFFPLLQVLIKVYNMPYLMETSTSSILDGGAVLVRFDWREFIDALSSEAKSHIVGSRRNQITFTKFVDEHVRGTPIETQLNRILAATDKLYVRLHSDVAERKGNLRYRLPKIKYTSSTS